MILCNEEETDEYDTEVFADVDRMDAKARHGWGLRPRPPTAAPRKNETLESRNPAQWGKLSRGKVAGAGFEPATSGL